MVKETARQEFLLTTSTLIYFERYIILVKQSCWILRSTYLLGTGVVVTCRPLTYIYIHAITRMLFRTSHDLACTQNDDFVTIFTWLGCGLWILETFGILYVASRTVFSNSTAPNELPWNCDRWQLMSSMTLFRVIAHIWRLPCQWRGWNNHDNLNIWTAPGPS